MLSNKTIINRYSSSVMYVSNILIYGFTGLYYCFIQLYLHGQTSLSATYIGFLLSMAQAVAIFAPPFWGVCADKAKYKKHVLLVLIIYTPFPNFSRESAETFRFLPRAAVFFAFT